MKRECGWCGEVATGLASITTSDAGEVFYCHGDTDGFSCYEQATIAMRFGADDGTRHTLAAVEAEMGI